MNMPVPLSKAELLDALAEIRAGVESGDTLEGSIEFLLPYPPAGDPEDADFMVRASYRIGNTMGQGGVRMIGVQGDPPPSVPPTREDLLGDG